MRNWHSRRRIGQLKKRRNGSGTAPGDVTGPFLTGATYDPVSNTLGFTSNEAGTLYWLWDTSALPLPAEVIETAAGGSSPVDIGLNLEPVSDDALPAGNWYLHWIVKDAAGNRRVGAIQANPIYLLDRILGSGAAYSTRRLRFAATQCMRVRRTPDNVEQDFGFAANGFLDTAALLAFCGSGSGFIVTWYDQTAFARHVTQSDTTRQPRIVNAGVLDVRNSAPSVFFNGTTHFLSNSSPFLYAAGAATICAVVSGTGSGGGMALFAETSSVNSNQAYQLGSLQGGASSTSSGFIRNEQNAITFGAVTPILTNVYDGVMRPVQYRDTGTAIEVYRNGASASAAHTRSGTMTVNRFSLGARWPAGSTGNNFFNTHMSEAIFFASALSPSDRTAIDSNQSTAFPHVTPVQRLAIINGTSDGGPSLAVNLGSGSDSEEPLLLDRAKSARGWLQPSFANTPSANLNSELALASLPAGQTEQNFFFSSFRDGNGVFMGPQPDRSGRFRMTFTGAATVAGFGITNLTQINANTYEFDCDMIGNKWFTFTPTAFPIKVTIVKTTDIAAHNAGGIFRQEYLNFLPTGGCYRFMGFMGTNERFDLIAPVVNWADFATENWQEWTRMPISAIVALSNAKSADPWICVPHRATDACVTALATYLRDNVNVARKIRVELSNEIWNLGTFDQGDYFAAQAQSVWGVTDAYSNNLYLHYAAKRFAQVMQIFNTVFAGQTNRLIGVIGAQAGWTATAAPLLDATQWQAREPGSYVAPYSLAKELSIAPYINYGADATAKGNAIKAQLDISHAAAVNYIKTVMIPEGLAQAKTHIDNYVPIAADRNLRLTMYEYNNHFDLANPGIAASALYSGGNPVPGALDVFLEATYSQEMADAQDELRTYFKAQNGSLMAFFADMSRASRFGTWGAVTHIGHTSPIWNDFLTWHANNNRNWNQG